MGRRFDSLPGATTIGAEPRAYRDYFDFVNDPANGLRTLTLPFEAGLEFTVRG